MTKFVLPSKDGPVEYQFTFIGEKRVFENDNEYGDDNVYGVPAGEYFLVGTLSCNIANYETVVAYIIDRNDKFECYNLQ